MSTEENLHPVQFRQDKTDRERNYRDKAVVLDAAGADEDTNFRVFGGRRGQLPVPKVRDKTDTNPKREVF